ncbi:TetR/AcrR family transcriptional regulator [Corallococcus sp. H22C18031201]|uniref:TetR/AcrR family transcriptional regulator n=1 Tax=Citreicoccus inhibens TaxID=2849499 RepID=UPI000E770207|nr:TetR/AcrR family transcriptional regulator [Citreicoccus inhibens]MBU8897592.1 TetR/AcrR family transcriptional regulator [Citreicoccus inhibens]RJS19273.1 TetR/AcrR family transcriptional regulator [Corallococcus sp. H22C18031201]
MRYGPEHKQATHARILAAAESLFRTAGFTGASVERVMRAAGMTVGGFYAHFASKEALLAEAIGEFMRKTEPRWVGGLEDLRGTEWVAHFARRYLSRQNRDNLETGCIVPSLLSDLTRGPPEAQAAFAQGLESLVAEATRHVPGGEGVTARQRALATLALCFGAMTLARATSSQALSDEVLQAARAFLVAEDKDPAERAARAVKNRAR